MSKTFEKKEVVKGLAQLLHKLDHGTDEEKKAAKTGMEAVMLLTNNGELYDQYMQCDNDSAKFAFFRKRVLKYLSDAREADLKIASYVFDTLKVDPDNRDLTFNGIRGVIFNAATVDNNGFRCDKDGKPAEDMAFRPLSGTTIAPWGTTKYYNEATDDLSDSDNGGKKVNVMYASLPKDHITVTVTTVKDTYIIEAGVKADLEVNETMLWRYLCGIWKSTTDDTAGEAYCARDVIIEAAKKSKYPEFSGGSDKLIKMIEAGHAKCMQHIQIGIMEALLGTDEAVLRNANESDIQRYLDLISTFGIIAEDEQKKILDDKVLETYLDGKGLQLSGMDENGKVVSGNTNTTAYQRAYIYALGGKVATKLHFALVANNSEQHPLKKEIIKAYADTSCK